MSEYSFTLTKAGEEKLKKVGYYKLVEICHDAENRPCPCTSIAGVYCQFPATPCCLVTKRDWKMVLNRRKK